MSNIFKKLVLKSGPKLHKIIVESFYPKNVSRNNEAESSTQKLVLFIENFESASTILNTYIRTS